MSFIRIPVARVDEMIEKMIKHLDYDLWKDSFDPETAEEPEFAAANLAEIRRIVRGYAT